MNAYERNSNIDVLITLSAHVLEDEDLETMRGADVSDVEIPHRLYRKIMRRIRKHDRQTEMSKAYIFVRRIAAVFLIVCSISFVFCLSVEAIRTEIWNTIVEWYEEYVEIHFENNGAVANVIEEYKEPTFVPDGFERQLIMQSPVNYIIYYNVDDERTVVYKQLLMNESITIQIDNEDCSIKDIVINGNKGQLYEYDDGKIRIMWLDNEWCYELTKYTGDLDSLTLIEMTESVK